MNSENTLYDTLEVSPRASTLVVKAAYRALAQSLHPDKNSGAAAAGERLAEINHAYSVLSDPVKRQSYDSKMGLHDGSRDRRGGGLSADGNFGHRVAGHKVSRPFGFRPFN
jgi:DnaJ-class molecular chaperone